MGFRCPKSTQKGKGEEGASKSSGERHEGPPEVGPGSFDNTQQDVNEATDDSRITASFVEPFPIATVWRFGFSMAHKGKVTQLGVQWLQGSKDDHDQANYFVARRKMSRSARRFVDQDADEAQKLEQPAERLHDPVPLKPNWTPTASPSVVSRSMSPNDTERQQKSPRQDHAKHMREQKSSHGQFGCQLRCVAIAVADAVTIFYSICAEVDRNCLQGAISIVVANCSHSEVALMISFMTFWEGSQQLQCQVVSSVIQQKLCMVLLGAPNSLECG
eukprot:CAMPEP_0206431844 /NCGR_PEP_ID=MMETSP0324_2-20121206/7585_1 /ASSEMBLY_ACC=CAM_ASM_000836 /TAXON_ID=2866 /ORGANISM="Crypthecodinium cohnii, Strain Seligo" /LENGTH=273 /DNA_ID=CAMNT_0053897807 /DNA_START=45 /DNA_END=866 /DNA_ORIENTATION=-